jgi:hypothetical protein
VKGRGRKKILLTLTFAAMASQTWALAGNDLLKHGEAFERMTRKAGSLEDSGDAGFFMTEPRTTASTCSDLGQRSPSKGFPLPLSHESPRVAWKRKVKTESPCTLDSSCADPRKHRIQSMP